MSLDCNFRLGGFNLVFCSIEFGGVSYKIFYSIGKVFMILFIFLVLVIFFDLFFNILIYILVIFVSF